MSVSEEDHSLHHILNKQEEADKQKEADKDKSSGKLDASNNDPLSDTLDISNNPPSNDNQATPTHHLSLCEVLLQLGPKIAEAYNNKVVTASWQELECRSISGKHSAAKQTLAPHLLEKKKRGLEPNVTSKAKMVVSCIAPSANNFVCHLFVSFTTASQKNSSLQAQQKASKMRSTH